MALDYCGVFCDAMDIEGALKRAYSHDEESVQELVTYLLRKGYGPDLPPEFYLVFFTTLGAFLVPEEDMDEEALEDLRAVSFVGYDQFSPEQRFQRWKVKLRFFPHTQAPVDAGYIVRLGSRMEELGGAWKHLSIVSCKPPLTILETFYIFS